MADRRVQIGDGVDEQSIDEKKRNQHPLAAPAARRIAGRPADFLKIAPGPIFGPRGGENRIPREKIFRFHPFS